MFFSEQNPWSKTWMCFIIGICLLIGQVPGSAQEVVSGRISLNSDQPGVTWTLRPVNDEASAWVPAVVPGAVFTSYVEAGVEKDPNYGDNINLVRDSLYDRDFWYRARFASPSLAAGELLWLNFEGVNRKAIVYLNGRQLGSLDGFMNRGKYEVSGILASVKDNELMVLVKWPRRPIPNHASPTYISSDSWDWMPSVPGLLQGITDDVFLSRTRAVGLGDAWVRTRVPDTSTGLVSLDAELVNHTGLKQSVEVRCVIQPGDIRFSRTISIDPDRTTHVFFDTARFRQLLLENPRLWWPNGYGAPNLYDLNIELLVDGQLSDTRVVKFGVREYSYDTLQGVFHINVNGRRVFAKGGNWGMSEYLLRCRGAEYDLKVKLHQEMNFNIIRNWIGSVTDEEFYDACDKYGMMVWDDFWLNSHPNLPDDVLAFNANAVEKIKRLRNHASIAVWCGDNEGYPLPPLNNWLREDVRAFDGDDRWYQANSHSDGLTGSGPWTNSHPNWYFTRYPGGFGGDPGWGFRTEIGTAVFTTFESFKKFMPKENWWPRNEMWNKHFFGKSAANGGPDRYYNSIVDSYGEPTGIEDFCRKAQLLNIETNKALFEGWQHHMWNDASGVMTWMSQSAYPSFVWQTYDYYYDLNGAYWGVKKACEPLHIQWSYADNSVAVSNTTLRDHPGLRATAEVFNMDGTLMKNYGQHASVNVAADSVTSVFKLNFVTDNLVNAAHAMASSTSADALNPDAVTDGSNGSRWSSNYTDHEWIYVDLGAPKEVASVNLVWESAFAKAFKLQVSDDAKTWKDVYATEDGKGGAQLIEFTPLTTRYIRMLGIKRASDWGYSLFEFEAFGKTRKPTDLSPVHFIRLKLQDGKGTLLSENFYWRSARNADYKALVSLPAPRLKTASSLRQAGDSTYINVSVRNRSKTPAVAVHVQAYDEQGERILPAIMDDNYFTLLGGESRELTIRFETRILMNKRYTLRVEPFNNGVTAK